MKQILTLFAIALLLSGCQSGPGTKETDGEKSKTHVMPLSTGRTTPTPPEIVQRGNPSSPQKALVIGNGRYAYSPLRNPVNDAKAMTQKLVDKGFRVTRATNLDQRTMTMVVQAFKKELSDTQEGVALFYFSGHGAQVNGQNYLIPVNNNDIKENNLGQHAVSAQSVLAMMREVNTGMNLLILDACRDDPYQGSQKSNTRGLARMTPPRGALIAFAAAPGQPALDGDGRNGLYTSHLLKALDNAEHKRIEDVFMEIRDPVYKQSNRRQEPWYQATMRTPFCFGGCQ
ncbi:MAG TPA: caspase family protein [Thioploca sp.]|nr:MAG: hypothetical protein B6247_24535 [Beggiatoa sp. 4572_84]RKZ62913.1 MAG: caspase family protein [Gammaproteobacteria bacterium]HDN27073.1 caspase family protein [Thioploca sp.]